MKRIMTTLIVMCMIAVQLPMVSFAAEGTASSDSDIEVQRVETLKKTAAKVVSGDSEQEVRIFSVQSFSRSADSPEIRMYTGDKVQIQIQGNTEDELVSYQSNKKSVASVSAKGLVSGKGAGSATITVNIGDVESAKVVVRVVKDTLTKPSLALKQNGSGLNISWNKVSYAETYEIYRKVGTGNWKHVATKDSSARAYTDHSIAMNKTYAYKIKATDVSYGLYRESAFSGSVSKKVTSISAPSSVKAERADYKSVKISWSKVNPATGYEIYRSKSGKSGTFAKIKTISQTDTLSYKNTNLKAGVKYYYKVRAVFDSKKGTFSAYKSATPGLNKPAVEKSASVTGSSIKIDWNKVSYAQGYYIYRKNKEGSWKKIATVKGNNTFTYKDTPSAGAYQYSVKAYRALDDENLFSARSGTVSARTLKAPTVTVSNPDNKLSNKVTWTKVTGATKYQIWRQNEGGSWKLVSTKSSSRTYTASVKHGETVKWKVRAVYEDNGCQSVGSYSKVKAHVVTYSPFYATALSKEEQSNIRYVSLKVENLGTEPMKIYGDGYIMDYYNADYDRELLLVDMETNKSMDDLIIEPGEEKTVDFKVIGNATRYNAKSMITFIFNYDEKTYAGVSSIYADNYCQEIVW